MKVQLDTPNPEMPPEQLEKINVNNTLRLQKEVNRTGVNELLLKTSSTDTNFTNTSYAVPLGMEGVFTNSGSWVRILFKTSVAYSGAIFVNFRLVLDGEVKDFSSFATPGSGGIHVLSWEGSLQSGRHLVKVELSVGSGTIALSENGSLTRLQVMEISL